MTAPCPALTEPDLAYIAALIDTRGALTSRTVRDAVLPQVSISGRPFAALKWLGEVTDVKVIATERAYSKAGCAEHCAEKHQHVQSVSGRWSVSGAKATIVLAAVQPYLRMRPAEIADLVTVGRAAKFKGATATKMAALGWPIPPEMAHG